MPLSYSHLFSFTLVSSITFGELLTSWRLFGLFVLHLGVANLVGWMKRTVDVGLAQIHALHSFSHAGLSLSVDTFSNFSFHLLLPLQSLVVDLNLIVSLELFQAHTLT